MITGLRDDSALHVARQRRLPLDRLLDEGDAAAQARQPRFRIHPLPQLDDAVDVVVLLVAVERCAVAAADAVEHARDARQAVDVGGDVAGHLELEPAVAVGGDTSSSVSGRPSPTRSVWSARVIGSTSPTVWRASMLEAGCRPAEECRPVEAGQVGAQIARADAGQVAPASLRGTAAAARGTAHRARRDRSAPARSSRPAESARGARRLRAARDSGARSGRTRCRSRHRDTARARCRAQRAAARSCRRCCSAGSCRTTSAPATRRPCPRRAVPSASRTRTRTNACGASVSVTTPKRNGMRSVDVALVQSIASRPCAAHGHGRSARRACAAHADHSIPSSL